MRRSEEYGFVFIVRLISGHQKLTPPWFRDAYDEECVRQGGALGTCMFYQRRLRVDSRDCPG
jgi:hypothetical protein